MGRVRGKGKKLSVTNHDDHGSGEEEKIPAQKKRGRPQKQPPMGEVEEEVEKIKDEEMKNGPTKEDNANETRSSTYDSSTKSNGFRHNGSRRKTKPRRAAEVGVECN